MTAEGWRDKFWLKFDREASVLWVYALVAALSVALLAYAVTRAFVWDEGFHLLAAQLIAAGKRPYLDFCFPQTPNNAYWNAWLLKVFGHGWRVPHVFAALFVSFTTFLVAQYILSRIPERHWRIPCAVTAVLFLAINPIVVQFGPIAQAYALAVLAGFVAFRLWTISNEGRPWLWAFLSGLAAGLAASATLLSAPIIPVLLIAFLFVGERRGNWLKAGLFTIGTAVPFVPVLLLFLQDAYVVFFNVVRYQAIFRRYHWDNPGPHDFEVLTSWAASDETLLIALFALGTLLYLRRFGWEPRARLEFQVCAAIALSLVLYISTAHPTFGRYYIVVIPFLAVLAGPGLYVVGSRLISTYRPWISVSVLAFILSVVLAHKTFQDRDAATFQRYAEISAKVRTVTPPHAEIFADEPVYFLLDRTPPSGMEFSYSHKLELPPKEEARLHIVSEKELEAQLKAGRFFTYQSCKDEQIDDWELEKVFAKQADVADCTVLWQPKH
jgi:4-amino-4-deoxy-L-arabinose transferase-like glycosyltransferase